MDESRSSVMSEDGKTFLPDCIYSLKTAISRHKNAISDSYSMSYISLTDTVTVLEEVSIDVEKIRKPIRADDQQHTALLADTTLSRKFLHCHSHRYHHQRGPKFFKPPHHRRFSRERSHHQQRSNDSYRSDDLRQCLRNKNDRQQDALNRKRP